jgi:hypothetical protein
MSEPTYGGHTLVYLKKFAETRGNYDMQRTLRDLIAAVEECEQLRADKERLRNALLACQRLDYLQEHNGLADMVRRALE